MFTKVHHVTYVVESIQEMADYLEKNFGLRPERTDEFTDQGFKAILYRIGPTLVDFFEPLRDDTAMAKQLRETGPGVMHVAWGVDGIDQAFQDLKAKGNQLLTDSPNVSPYGYKTFNIALESAQGIYFQLAEGELS